MKLLIDADSIIYTACAAVETAIEWEVDQWGFNADAGEAKERITAKVKGLVKELKATSVLMALSGEGQNWRTKVLPTYKRNRTGRKPICYAGVKAWVEKEFDCRKYANLEGDDVLGILATHPKLIGKCIVVAVDKDIKCVPGLHFNPDKDEELREVDAAAADRWHLYQTLTGDKVDGYDGCPGIGPVSAERLLEKSPTWETVRDAYTAKGLNEATALTQARVARILRYGEYDTKTGSVKLWSPEA